MSLLQTSRMIAKSALLFVLLFFLTVGFSSSYLELLGLDQTEIVKETKESKDSEENESESKEEVKLFEADHRALVFELAGLSALRAHHFAFYSTISILENPTPPPEFM